MKLIVGLGNPGDIYADSRHNIGFSVVKTLAKFHKITLKRDRGTFSLSGKGKMCGQNVILAMPITFMNLSGTAVSGLMKKYKLDLESLLVVCDDLDLEFGRQKLRPAGSSAGHRGVGSIKDSLRSVDFARLRIGIGRPLKNIDPSEYVLSPFSRQERTEVREMIARAADCCESWAAKGVTETMNIFNTRSRTND